MFKYYLGRLLCSADLFTKLYDIQNPKILAGNLIFTSAKQEIIYYYSSEIEELMSSVNREKDNLNDSCIQVFKTKIYDKIVQITSPESLKNYNEKLGEEILNRMNP